MWRDLEPHEVGEDADHAALRRPARGDDSREPCGVVEAEVVQGERSALAPAELELDPPAATVDAGGFVSMMRYWSASSSASSRTLCRTKINCSSATRSL